MAIQKAEAIVLRARRQGETSKLLSLYTREFGRVAMVAKGSRGPRSKYQGALELFNHLAIVFYRKEERGLQYLSQASILSPFLRLHEQLGRIALAGIVCEIVERSEVESRPQPQLFQLLLEALKALDTAEFGLRNIVRAFMLQFASLAGFEPNLSACSTCRRTDLTASFFRMSDGCYLCADCGRSSDGRLLSEGALRLLRCLAAAPLAAAARIAVDRELGDETDAFLIDYLALHVEGVKGCRSFAHLKSLQNHLMKSSDLNGNQTT